MNPSVSFLEFRLANGRLQTVLGSGPCEDVMRRDIAHPYVRLCMRDAEVVEHRVRCGTVEWTSAGRDYCQWDEFQFRGASIQAFVWCGEFARWVEGRREQVRENLLARQGWLEYLGGTIAGVEESEALLALRGDQQENRPRLFVDFSVPPEHVDEVLQQLYGSPGD